MYVSKSSWHYRMIDWCWNHVGKSPANTLCGYFWQMVLSPFVVIWFYGVILVLIFLALSWAFYFSGAVACNILNWFHVLPNSFAIEPMTFNWRHVVASLLISSSIASYYFYKFTHEKTKTPNVVFEFIKAKKRKICPFIEFKD